MTLLEISELIVDTEHKTAPYISSGIPSIRTPNVGKGRLVLDKDLKFVDQKTYEDWTRRAIPKKDDLIIAREAPVGNVAIVPEIQLCLGQRTVLVRPDKEKVNSQYLCYYLLSPEMQHKMLSGSGGSTVSHLNMKDIRNLNVSSISPLPTQRRIAAILSAYDDLMEDNQRRIQLLEQAAKCEYRLIMEESETELIPISQLVSLIGGYAFKSKDWRNDGSPVIKIKNIDNNTVDIDHCDCVPENVAQAASRFELFEGNLLIAMTGATVGKVGLMPKLRRRYYLNQRVGLFISKLEYDVTPLLFVAFNEQSVQQQVLNLAGGAAQPNISGGQIESITVQVPIDSKLLQAFCKIGSETIQLISNLKDQNNLLRQARDILLPKLMSGEIEV